MGIDLGKLKERFSRFVEDPIYRSSFNITIAQVFNTVSLLVIDIVFARVLEVEDFGSWKQINLIINFLIPLSVFGLAEGFKYYSAKEENHLGLHFKNVSKLLVGISFGIFLFVLVGGMELISGLFNNERLIGIRFYLPVLFFLIIWNRILWYVSINKGKTKYYLYSTAIGTIVALSYFIVLAYLYHGKLIDLQGLLSYFAIGLVLGFLIRNIILYLKLKKENIFAEKGNLNKQIVGSYFKYGIPLYLTSFIAIITLNTDKTIVSYFGGVEEFAVFSIGAREIPFIGILSASLAQSQFPKIVSLLKNGQNNQAKNLWIKSTKDVSMILFPLILLLMLFSKPLILLVFGEKYLPGIPVFRAYLLILLWRNNYYGALLSASGQTKWITVYSAVSMLINLLCSVVLYYSFGIIGVVYATFIAVSVANILQLRHEKMLLPFIRSCLLNPVLFLCTIATFSTYILLTYFGW